MRILVPRSSRWIGSSLNAAFLSVGAITEIHDRQIVATALVLIDRGDSVAILTRDANITASGLVPVIW
jgi:hypothetical protein